MLSEREVKSYEALREVVARLRAPDGCPWDREQTHSSLRPYVIEEAYEVLAVLDAGDTQRLPEELGDLLLQIVLHSQLAEEAGEFEMAHVLEGLADKLIRRHPHVFGDVKLETAGQVNRQWDELKQRERGTDESVLANVPGAMPALAYTQTLLRRAETAGFAWPKREDVLDKLQEELRELEAAQSPEEAKAELGDLLLNVANYARYLGIDAEEALREAGHKFRRRFTAVESTARDRGLDLKSQSRDALMSLWTEAKAAEG
ncbi:MAG TPA: nucleoside triphosphate pyrophosphohydrolase [Dehalococcoidia bacterium]|nr:nucleoside triphosphate pyrophosphohydrolase [Dehalococcoidia bacterium]